MVGPFQERILLTIKATDGLVPVDGGSFAIEGIAKRLTDFYLRPAPHQAAHRFSPVALALSSDVAIECDIRWDGVCHPDIVGEAR
jgi:hypothetical protein